MDVKYIAGFFDGEGSIGLYHRKDKVSFSMRTQLTQNKNPESLKIMTFLKKKYGGNITEQKTLSNKIKFNWQLNVNMIERFLKDIKPYSILKKKQLIIALNWIRKRPKQRKNTLGHFKEVSKSFIQYSLKCSQELKQMKKG